MPTLHFFFTQTRFKSWGVVTEWFHQSALRLCLEQNPSWCLSFFPSLNNAWNHRPEKTRIKWNDDCWLWKTLIGNKVDGIQSKLNWINTHQYTCNLENISRVIKIGTNGSRLTKVNPFWSLKDGNFELYNSEVFSAFWVLCHSHLSPHLSDTNHDC